MIYGYVGKVFRLFMMVWVVICFMEWSFGGVDWVGFVGLYRVEYYGGIRWCYGIVE